MVYHRDVTDGYPVDGNTTERKCPDMEWTDILIGIFFAVIVWKLLKITFKAFLWILVIGLIAAFAFPDQLPLIGDAGLTILSFLGSLLLLAVVGFFFFTND